MQRIICNMSLMNCLSHLHIIINHREAGSWIVIIIIVFQLSVIVILFICNYFEEWTVISLNAVYAMLSFLPFIKVEILLFNLVFCNRWIDINNYSYKEDVYIMKELSSDGIPIPIGGVCVECGKPCCLQATCSVISEKDGYKLDYSFYNYRKRYCKHHIH